MSTVGFGDLHPHNNFERILCWILFLVGNYIFAVIIPELIDMIERIKSFNSVDIDKNALNKFFNLISRYNKRVRIKE